MRDTKNISDNESNIFQSNCVPFNTQLIVPADDRPYTDMRMNVDDSIFFVEDWTFLNSEGLEMAKQYRRCYPYNELRIILINSKRRTLSTDSTSLQNALNDAVFAYEQEGFSVTIVQQNDIPKLFFWKFRDYRAMIQRDFWERIRHSRSLFDNSFDLNYEILGILLKDEMLHPESLDKLLSYDERLGGKKIKIIVPNAVQLFFDKRSQFMQETSEMLKKFTNEICLWDEDKVFNNLKNILVQHFRMHMEKSLPLVTISQTTEEVYNRFMCDTKFNVIFMQSSDMFFYATAKDIIKSYINNIFKKMEELYD